MTGPTRDTIKETGAMISGMAPALDPATYAFVTTRDPVRARDAAPRALATFREDEGLSLILPLATAQDMAFADPLPMARITLTVQSALDGTGLTAAVATALAAQGIPCNMVAAFHHDHVFVPADMADSALATLTTLAAQGSP
jgi:hypothetical protein